MNPISDLRAAARSIGHAKGLLAFATATLGAGIGVNTALFTLLDAVLLRPVPGVVHSGDLVRILRSLDGTVQGNQSYPDYLDCRNARSFAGLAAERLVSIRMAGPPAELAPGAIVTGNYFQVMGARPLLGRLLDASDDEGIDTHPVVVLSEAFWRQRFGADENIVGRNLSLNGYRFTVAGVARAPFAGVEFGQPTALWMPISMVRQAMTRNRNYDFLGNRRAGWLTFYGRLWPETRLEAAQSELTGTARRLESIYPATNRGRSFVVAANAGMSPERRESMRALLTLLTAGAGLVLLIACGNVGNLMLARAAGRVREMAIRMSLGAGRGDLLRQLAFESAIYGLAGGAAGVLMAWWTLPFLEHIALPQGTNLAASVIDARVLLFDIASVTTAVFLFGSAPAWFILRQQGLSGLYRATADESRAGTRPMGVWVVSQVALSFALVASAAMVLGSMRKIVAIDPGYRPRGIVVAAMDLSLTGYSPERGTQFFADLSEAVSSLPGVRSATVAKSSPAVDWSDRVAVFADGSVPAGTAGYSRAPGAMTVDRNIVAPGYFRTLGIPLLTGRDFAWSDRRSQIPVAIVSRSLAERLWPGEDPRGKRIVIPIDGEPLPSPTEIIGVAADARYRSVLNGPAPLLYTPIAQQYDSIGRLMASVEGNPAPLKAAIRQAIQRADPELPVLSLSTIQEQIESSLWQRRAAAALLSLCGLLAAGLACAGIYAVLAYATARGRRDVAIRMALGARPSAVLAGVLARTVKLTALGIAAGLPLAIWAKPGLKTLLYDAGPVAPAALSSAGAVFLAVALAAGFVPARRAATIDPVASLRQQ
jgi:predicted permease